MKAYRMQFGSKPTPKWDASPVSLQMEFVEDFERSFTVKKGERIIYIPRSIVTYRRKWTEGSGRKMIEFTLPQWKVQQEGLEKWVIG